MSAGSPLNFSRKDADVFVPDGSAPGAALARTTHLCIGAHQDDIEIMAYPGIAACRGKSGLYFTGVVATDGAGSPRSGRFAKLSDAEMKVVRRDEQRKAASLGGYNLQIQLGHPSGDVKQPGHAAVAGDLDRLFSAAKPDVAYLHNPADSHDTHVALLIRCLEAIKRRPSPQRPAQVLGCEVWRGLDWLTPADKTTLDAGADPKLAKALVSVFESQVAGGKRYDEATLARRAANATFLDARTVDGATALVLAVDLTPVTRDGGPSIEDFTMERVERFRRDVKDRLTRLA